MIDLIIALLRRKAEKDGERDPFFIITIITLMIILIGFMVLLIYRFKS